MKKNSIIFLIFGAIILFLIFFVLNLVFNQIQIESQKIIIQKKEFLESADKIKNIRDFMEKFKQYQPNIEKISNFFINTSEPIEFIEFMEKEAAISRVSVEIAPPVLNPKGGGIWPSLGFNLNIKGTFPNFLEFLDKLESSPYLVRLESASIRRLLDDRGDGVSAELSIK